MSLDEPELKIYLFLQLILLSLCLFIEFIGLIRFQPHREDAWHFPMLLSLVWTVILRLQQTSINTNTVQQDKDH